MIIIDSHQHFWRYDAERDQWITPEMKAIRQDFLPEHLEPVLNENRVDGCIVIQSNQSARENYFQINNSLENDFVLGVVGWVDLQAADIGEQLSYLSNFKRLKGFRHILQAEPDRALMLKKTFMRGIGLLAQYDFTYDILIHADQLENTEKLVKAFPYQKFVLNHLAKPPIKSGKRDKWTKDIKALAKYPNLYCKISGLVTEADWKNWTQKDFEPYLDVVTQAFGMKRLMFGSDWPVCLVSCNYAKVKRIVEKYYQTFSQDEKDAFYGSNAISFYNI